ncbi:carnitine O-acetyltransferase [Saccharomycopsis crataegensis]|uniref:Carnitine O-acetyltransferase n=1 Tax=Saccharomycopsis crataegensis TaxID=43959 RepID=A0AAV5QIH0_9ASCO|nr:carnitine O-acetyltransferase [Saccharomycopsis crataegensis]
MPETTFQFQDALSKLPIPDLPYTCAKYLEILQPLQTEREHAQTQIAVKDFLNNPLSKKLDQQLREYSRRRASYIEDFWYESYLNYDSPVVLNLNPFFLIEDDPNPIRPSQVKRAASITISALRFVRAIRRNELVPDKIRGQPLDMYQYTKLFGSARVPTLNGCVMQTDSESRHLVVVCRSQFYWFNVLDNNDDLLLDQEALLANFKAIVRDSQKSAVTDIAKSSFGLLTTENRRVWAKIRQKMTNSINNDILKIIDSALFVVCLDDVEIESQEELSINFLCGLSNIENGVQIGTCTNRWYDKLQIIITKNSKVGINFEHTGVDGHTVLRFVSDIYTDSILSFAKSINASAPSIWNNSSPEMSSTNDRSNITPTKLNWDLSPDLSLSLRFAETRLSDLIQQTEFAVLEFKGYGSNMIKKFGCSPDAFVQMSFQATYYALYGKVECTYEPAMTKKFFHGRTEAIRTVSNESNLYVRKFFENIPAITKLSLLRAACQKHSARTKDSSNGLGVDRHLYALFCIWKKWANSSDSEEESINDDDSDTTVHSNHEDDEFSAYSKELPSIFANSGWDKLNNSVISTSNCGNPSLRLFGFGPVTQNGFGLAYIIKEESVTIVACSKHRQTRRFVNTLNSYFVEVSNLYRETQTQGVMVDNIPEHQFDERNNRFKSLQNSISVKKDQQVNNPSAGNSSVALNYLLGGYGYFDVGEDEIKSRDQSPEPPFKTEGKEIKIFRAKKIEKKLKLAEY